MSQQPIPNPGSNDPLNEMFLSPRVIDRTAFEQFTTKLDELISRAKENGDSLKQTTSDAGQLETRLQRAAAELELKAQRVAGLVPSIDDRLAQIESILEETVDKAASQERIREQVNRLIAGRLESMDEEIEEIVQAAGERVSRMDSTPLRLESDAAHRLTDCESRLNVIERRLSAMENAPVAPDPDDVRSLSDQAHEARNMLAQALLSGSARIDTLEDQSDEAVAALEACVLHAQQRCDEIKRQRLAAEESAGASLDRLDDVTGDASQRLAMMLAALSEKERAAASLAQEMDAMIAKIQGQHMPGTNEGTDEPVDDWPRNPDPGSKLRPPGRA